MKRSIFTCLILLFFHAAIFGQGALQDIDSASLFDKELVSNPKLSSPNKRTVVAISDTSFLITAKVLKNLEADAYRITFSLNQEAETLKACKQEIDDRIQQFIKALKEAGIEEQHIYIDRTGQYPIYGYDIERKVATQVQEGYEINRNIVIHVESAETINKLVDIAAEQEIHDVVRTEHLIDQPELIYEELYQEAIKVINRKKDLYLNASGLKVKPEAMVYSEQFEFVFPEDRYKKYEAAMSSEVTTYSYRVKRFKEDQRKKMTFYYEGLNFSGFDRVISPNKVQVGLQAVFGLQIKFERAD